MGTGCGLGHVIGGVMGTGCGMGRVIGGVMGMGHEGQGGHTLLVAGARFMAPGDAKLISRSRHRDSRTMATINAVIMTFFINLL
jgi:hypothetical protein